MIWPLLAVWAGELLKVPHAPALPQVAVQLIPALPVSGVAVANRVNCDPVSSVEGGVEELGIATAIGAAVTTVAAAVATFVESLVDLAVMVMTPPAGTVEVLLNVAVAPLAVWLVILPQLEVPQLRLQSTPRPAESLETTAAR